MTGWRARPSSLGVLSFFLLLGAVAARPLLHDDLFFHLRTGALIIQSGSVPRVDSFSHTMPGAAWTSHEWGFGLLVYGVYRLAGYSGLVCLASLLAVALFAMIYLLMRRVVLPERSLVLVPLLLVGMLAAARPCFILRAALLSSLGMAILQYLLHLHHTARRPLHTLAIIGLFFVWANVHVGVVFGLLVLWFYWVQGVVDAGLADAGGGWKERALAATKSGAGLVLCCTLVTLVTPNGWKLWMFPFELNALYYHSGIDWRLNMFQTPAVQTYPFFYLLLALTLAACLPLRRLFAALRSRKHPMVAQSLSTLFFCAMALRSSRFIPELVTFALPFCSALFGGLLSNAGRDPSVPGITPRWAGWAQAGNVALVVATAVLLRPSFPRTPIPDDMPKRVSDFMQREHIRGRMFNPERWGGYLGWRLNARVYWDGRNDVFGPLAKELAYTKDFGQLVERHRLDILLLDERYQTRFAAYLAANRAAWGLPYFDDKLALYVRRTPERRELLTRYDYRLLRPFGVPSDDELRNLGRDDAATRRLELEIAWLLDQDPNSYTGWYVRGSLADARGDPKTAYRCFERASRIAQPARVLYQLARVAHELGKDAEARQLLQRAISNAGS